MRSTSYSIYLALVISYHLSHLLHLTNTITFSVFSDNKSLYFLARDFWICSKANYSLSTGNYKF